MLLLIPRLTYALVTRFEDADAVAALYPTKGIDTLSLRVPDAFLNGSAVTVFMNWMLPEFSICPEFHSISPSPAAQGFFGV